MDDVRSCRISIPMDRRSFHRKRNIGVRLLSTQHKAAMAKWIRDFFAIDFKHQLPWNSIHFGHIFLCNNLGRDVEVKAVVGEKLRVRYAVCCWAHGWDKKKSIQIVVPTKQLLMLIIHRMHNFTCQRMLQWHTSTILFFRKGIHQIDEENKRDFGYALHNSMTNTNTAHRNLVVTMCEPKHALATIWLVHCDAANPSLVQSTVKLIGWLTRRLICRLLPYKLDGCELERCKVGWKEGRNDGGEVDSPKG